MRILVLTDFSPHSQRAVRRAGILAGRHDGDLFLMHAVEGDDEAEIEQDLREARRMIGEQTAVVPELAHLACEPLVARGRLHDEIIAAAVDREIDLIVVGAPQDMFARDIGRTSEA